MIPTLAGVLVLALLFADVFRTVFHARGRFGPLNRLQNRAIWSAFQGLGSRMDEEPRRALLALAAPVMIVMTLFGWVVLLTLGFGLIYLPSIDGFLFSPGSARSDWVEAIYYSGYTAATLGVGDMVPDLEIFRLLAPVQAFSGFALISVSITYLLATYSELIMMRTLASDIAGYFRANDVGSQEFVDMDGYAALARWSENTTVALLHVLEAHFQYPVLHYFHSPDDARALPVQLGRLLALDDRAEESAGDSRRALSAHPSFRALSAGVRQYVEEVDRHFLPEVRGNDDPDYDTREAHARLLRYMSYR